MPWRAAIRAHLCGRIDESALGGNVGDRDQLGPRPDRPVERIHVDLSGGVVVHHVDLDVHTALHLEEGEIVRGVLGPRGDDPVPGTKGDGIERHVPGPRGVLHEGDLVTARADQAGHGVVDVGHLVRRLCRGLVSADGGLALEVAGHRVDDGARRQGRSGVVEVQDVGDAGRVGSQKRNVECHWPNSTAGNHVASGGNTITAPSMSSPSTT